jgi:hypothetical protein
MARAPAWSDKLSRVIRDKRDDVTQRTRDDARPLHGRAASAARHAIATAGSLVRRRWKADFVLLLGSP